LKLNPQTLDNGREQPFETGDVEVTTSLLGRKNIMVALAVNEASRLPSRDFAVCVPTERVEAVLGRNRRT